MNDDITRKLELFLRQSGETIREIDYKLEIHELCLSQLNDMVFAPYEMEDIGIDNAGFETEETDVPFGKEEEMLQ